MEAFPEITPLWDLSQATTFSQLADDDFLALLQKQFPSATNPSGNLSGDFAVDPQSISRFSLPSLNPPSEDSSPSPPRSAEAGSSMPAQDDDDSFVQGDTALKRKASDDDLEEGPSQKSQHTAGNSKKGASASKRKSTGGPDENRLLKRKEQNRAAQRAFRERKEKHVKDLEDKVAALEARNDQTTTENENLRDLLARLQSENMALKQGSFTFQVPKTAGRSIPSPSTSTLSPPENSLSASFSRNSPKPSLQKYTNPLDLSSLTAFDPSVLDLLDEPQVAATATTSGGAMEMDFGYNKDKGYLTSNFTTIANNPAFFSLASMFDPTPTPSPPTGNSMSNSDTPSFNFDMNSLTAWSPPSAHDSGTLDDLFGSYMDHSGIDLNSILSPPTSISPIVHQANLNTHGTSPDSSSSSPSSNASDPSLFGTPIEGSSSESDLGHDEGTCPKTKMECVRHVDNSGLSPFVTNSAFFRKAGDNALVSGVSCQGSSSFPKTTKNDSNIEVLSAWRSITSNPNFKDCDINELCSEFSSKARCDGSKVVLEPSGVQHILKNLSKNRA
ncbi:uncharacterized protein ARMOST_08715 [Armillaria ostoyae]|uniref:BZIP domain-containing protein n=1 Tax=Armillaria ostoyae TaxID=47428 RepID=A0A284R9D7_ARMOS|nr:uncharacterized protein ARMOST_08715 [Armillaria ostoyae]